MVIADPRPDVVPEVLGETVYASWTARVVATILDGLALSGLGYLVAGTALHVDVIPPVTFGTDTSSMSDVAPGALAVLVAVVPSRGSSAGAAASGRAGPVRGGPSASPRRPAGRRGRLRAQPS